MPSTQKRLFAFSAFLWHCVLVAGLLAHSSCANQEPKQTNTEPAKKEQAVNDISKDSLAPPIVIPITPANRPKIIKAGNPIITIDSSGIGTPFFTNYTTDQGLPINFVTACIQDKEGNIWVGTGGGGLVKFNGKNFTTYTTAQGLSDNVDGGYNVGFKVTTGGSTTSTNTTSTTTSYTLADDNAGGPTYEGDYVSVNVKKDPVYGTRCLKQWQGAHNVRTKLVP